MEPQSGTRSSDRSGPQRTSEGKGYLVDHYAVLGVARDASAEHIRAAYRAKSKLWHSDRIHGMAEELAAIADARMRVFTEARDRLLDREKRAELDAELASWTGPVSTDGREIIDLLDTGFSPLALLSDPNRRDEALAAFERDARVMTGFDPELHSKLAAEAARGTGISPALRDAYADSLGRLDTYLAIKEDRILREIGSEGFTGRFLPEAYHRATRDKVSAARQAFQRSSLTLLVDAAEGRLQLTGATGERVQRRTREDPGMAIELYRREMTQEFDRLAAMADKISLEREFAATKRLELLDGSYPGEQAGFYPRVILVFRPPDSSPPLALPFLIAKAGSECTIQHSSDLEDLASAAAAGEVAACIAAGVNVIEVPNIEGLPLQGIIREILSKHAARARL